MFKVGLEGMLGVVFVARDDVFVLEVLCGVLEGGIVCLFGYGEGVGMQVVLFEQMVVFVVLKVGQGVGESVGRQRAIQQRLWFSGVQDFLVGKIKCGIGFLYVIYLIIGMVGYLGLFICQFVFVFCKNLYDIIVILCVKGGGFGGFFENFYFINIFWVDIQEMGISYENFINQNKRLLGVGQLIDVLKLNMVCLFGLFFGLQQVEFWYLFGKG